MARRLLEQSLAGESQRLKEYVVSIEAFGKPAGYDMQADPSVRVQASRLRQSLEEYYRSEGADDDVIIEFPKGRYELTFRGRSPVAEPPAAVIPARSGWHRNAVVYLGIMVAVCVAAIALLVSERKTHAVTKAAGLPQAVQQIWARYLTGTRPALISIGTPMFVHHRIHHTGVLFGTRI